MILFKDKSFFSNSLNPLEEAIAYELLWTREKASFKSLAELFLSTPNDKPSDFVDKSEIDKFKKQFCELFFLDEVQYKSNFLMNFTIDYQ